MKSCDEKTLHFIGNRVGGTARRRWIRRGVRLTALGAAFSLALPPLFWSESAPKWLPAISPFSGLSAAAAVCALEGTAGLPTAAGLLLAALPVLFLATVGRRLFCRWLCPTGLVLDTVGRGGYGKAIVRRMPNLGRAIMLTTWAGALVGWPLFLWLDPLAIFSASFGHGPYHAMAAAGACAIGLSILVPKLWCTRLCPLGATQDLIRDAAVAIGRRAAGRNQRAATATSPGRSATRRAWLGTLLAGGLFAAVGYWGSRRPTDADGAVLRPPGARPADIFWRLCLRCGNCLAACPERILRPDDTPEAALALGAPILILNIDGGHCLETCNACTQVCPSRALEPLSLEAKLAWPIGTATIDRELCLLTYDQECQICLRACPRDAISFHSPDGGYSRIASVDVRRCNGCGACIAPCPGENTWEIEADPTVARRKAIRVGPVRQ